LTEPLGEARLVRRDRPAPRRPGRAAAAAVALGAVCFAAGIAVGQALEDGSPGNSTATFSRTLVPVTVPPPAAPTTTR
jgi:hypothetical protein